MEMSPLPHQGISGCHQMFVDQGADCRLWLARFYSLCGGWYSGRIARE